MKSETQKAECLTDETQQAGDSLHESVRHNSVKRMVAVTISRNGYIEELEREIASLKEQMSPESLAEALVKAKVIDGTAFEDPEWYDGGITTDKIKKLSVILLSNAEGDSQSPDQ